MPSRWEISLAGFGQPRIPLEAPHAVVSRWLDMEHRAPVKPYALSPPAAQDGRLLLEVRLLDDGLAERLQDQAPVGLQVRLGAHHFNICEPPALREHASWQALAASGGRGWDVEFRSLTTFRTGNRTSPLPAPHSVLTGLRSRWAALCPPDMTRLPETGGLWVTDLDGRSEAIQLRDTVVSGFLGRVRYESEGDNSVGALLAFAGYAGIGAHTAFGLGTVKVNLDRPRRLSKPP